MSTNPLTNAAFAQRDDFAPFGRLRDGLTAGLALPHTPFPDFKRCYTPGPGTLAVLLVSTLPGLLAPPF